MYWWILQNALVSGMLAATVAAVCRLGRFSPTVKHALWLIVLIKLITPPLGGYPVPRAFDEPLRRLTSGLPPQRITPRPDVLHPTEALSVAEITEILPTLTMDQVLEEAFPEGSLDQDLASAVEEDCAGINRSRLRWMLPSLWLAGAAALGGIQLVRLIRLWRFVRQSASAPAWLDRLVHQTAERLHIRPPQVAVVPALCSPMICGLGRPHLLWPARLSDHLNMEAREAVVLHELAHLRRRDHLVAWLDLVTSVIWWFNPIYWYARCQLRENAELACDAWVVALLPAGRRAYAHALVEVTEFVSSAPAALPAVAMGNIARTSLERRLTMILRESFSCRVPLMGSALIGLTLLAVLPGWSPGGQQDESSADNPSFFLNALAALGEQPSDPSSGKQDTQKPSDDGKLPDLPKPPAPATAGSQQAVSGGATVAGSQGQTGNANVASSGSALAGPVAGTSSAALAGPAVQQTANAPAPSVAVGTADQQGQTSADRRIEEVEAKLTQLLAEIQQLRGSGSQAAQMQQMMGGQSAARKQVARPDAERLQHTGFMSPMGAQQRRTPAASPSSPFGAYQANKRLFDAMGAHREAAPGQAPGDVETLTRAKYKLPEPVADAARAFIEKYFKSDIGAKVEGDVLTIIASPEDQQRISIFVELLRDSDGAGSEGGPGRKR